MANMSAQSAADEFREESEIFLRAMSRAAPRPAPSEKSGFPLGEQCPALSQFMKRKKAKIPARDESAEPEIRTGQESGADDENAEFLLAVRNATPLGGKGRMIAPGARRIARRPAREPDFDDCVAASLEFALFCSDEYLEGRVAGLDETIMNRLRAGQLSPEASLDLHGLNASQAFEALKFFVRDAWFKGLRTALIVTGRGRNSPRGQPVLRQMLQSWLTQEPFKRVTLAFCTARPRDGGPGSVYVLLRRYRKKGRIFWERLPGEYDF